MRSASLPNREIRIFNILLPQVEIEPILQKYLQDKDVWNQCLLNVMQDSC